MGKLKTALLGEWDTFPPISESIQYGYWPTLWVIERLKHLEDNALTPEFKLAYSEAGKYFATLAGLNDDSTEGTI